MFKKIFNLINKKKHVKNTEVGEENLIKDDNKNNQEIDSIETKIEKVTSFDNEEVSIEEELEMFLKENEEYIKDIKIRRGKSIRSVDIYSEEVLDLKLIRSVVKLLRFHYLI